MSQKFGGTKGLVVNKVKSGNGYCPEQPRTPHAVQSEAVCGLPSTLHTAIMFPVIFLTPSRSS